MLASLRIIPSIVLLFAATWAGCAAPPLYEAAWRGDLETVRNLVDQGAVISERHVWADSNGQPGTALQIAAYFGHVDVMRFLLDRAPAGASGHDGALALVWAAHNGQAEAVQLLLDRGVVCCMDGLDAVKTARRHGHMKVVQLLERAGTAQAAVPLTAATPAPSPAESARNVPASDVDVPPAVRAKARPNAYAVLIGIEQYRQNLPKADYASHDAQITRDYLTKVMGYQDENVAVLLNDKATKTDMEKYVEHWLPNRIEKDASVFFYFSGHGAPNPKTGDAYLVPYDGDPAFVEATGYPLKRLYEHLNTLPAKEVIVLLDSCFSGAGGRSVIAKGMRPMFLSVENPILAGGKMVILAASSAKQFSSTYDQKSHGLLTYYFLKGLRGEADANGDGSVELAELYDFLKPQVERTARREYNNEQTPQLLGSPELLAKGVRLIEPLKP